MRSMVEGACRQTQRMGLAPSTAHRVALQPGAF